VAFFEWSGLVRRNPSYVTTQARASWEVAKAMKAFASENTFCAWCGRTKRLQVHHIIPVSVAPERAADVTNMIMLCGKRCHITVGHAGHFRNSYVPDVWSLCATCNPVKVEDTP
jgi:5-methylcytosine-specific restriction endonuclease McrA